MGAARCPIGLADAAIVQRRENRPHPTDGVQIADSYGRMGPIPTAGRARRA